MEEFSVRSAETGRIVLVGTYEECTERANYINRNARDDMIAENVYVYSRVLTA